MYVYSKDSFYNFLSSHPDIVKITLDEDTYNKIDESVSKLILEKRKETAHIIDSNYEKERQIRGLLSESAIEKLLGINIIEQSIGESSKYNHPDIPGYAVGIKSTTIGHCPLIPKKNNYAQIINIMDFKNRIVYVMGLATPGVLNVYQNDKYVFGSAKNLGQKTAFTGFNHLLPVHSLDDLVDQKYEVSDEL